MNETDVARVALVIGVNEYLSLDAEGAANLRGARNDAISWAMAAHALGITEIRVLTSPVLSPEDLPVPVPGATFGEATSAAIRDGVQWMAQQLGSAGLGQGMVAYSGHGAEDERGLLLCPSDVTGGLAEAIPYADVAALLGQHAPQTNVTFFLDTCHAAPVAAGPRMLQSAGRRSLVHHSSRTASEAAPSRGLRPGDMVLASCRTNEVSAEAFLQNGVHGAFTWAATATLSRGGLATDPDSGLSFFGIGYRELLQRTHGLLTSLGFQQRPVLEGPAPLVDLPILHTRTLSPVEVDPIGAQDTSREVFPEDAEGGSPVGFALYEITDTSGSNILGYLLAVADNDVSFQGETWSRKREYWMWIGTPWPTVNFRLALLAPSEAPTLDKAGAQKFTSQPFPNQSGTTRSVNQTNGTWWSISFSATPLEAQIGWLKVKAGQQNDWYEYTDVVWFSAGGQSFGPEQWFRVVPVGASGPYQNNYLYFFFASGGPSSTTDTHPGDHSSSSQGEYIMTHSLKTIDSLHT